MKKLEKDFLLAWLLGMVLPGVIMFLMAGLNTNHDMIAATDHTISDPTLSELQVLTSDVSIPVLTDSGAVTDTKLEHYLWGVVLAEMPADFEIEALKAQSVVARTYALRRLGQGTKHPGGAVCIHLLR